VLENSLRKTVGLDLQTNYRVTEERSSTCTIRGYSSDLDGLWVIHIRGRP